MPFSRNYLEQLREVIGQRSIGNPEHNMTVKTIDGYKVEATVKPSEDRTLRYLNNHTGVAVQVYKEEGNRNIIEQVIDRSRASAWTSGFSQPQAGSKRIKAGLFLRADVNADSTGFERQDEIIREHVDMVSRVINELENTLR